VKFSLEWIREHVAVQASDEQIAERLTAGGHAVEGKEVQDGDTVLDLEIVTNRPDCMNVRGVAREVAAFFRAELNPLDPPPSRSTPRRCAVASWRGSSVASRSAPPPSGSPRACARPVCARSATWWTSRTS